MSYDKYKNLKILYVEDDELTRENTLEILERKCDTVFCASDGREGLEIYEREKPDIIITDIQMPKLDGISMAKKIRETDIKTLIIITTAYTDQKYLLDAVELQLIKYVTKPIHWDKISHALSACIKYLKEEEDTKKHIVDDVYFDTFSKLLIENNNTIYLTNHERDLLDLLVKRKDNMLTYEEIESNIWPDKGMSRDAIKSLTKSLRKKLPKDSIKNLYGYGYKLNLLGKNNEK